MSPTNPTRKAEIKRVLAYLSENFMELNVVEITLIVQFLLIQRRLIGSE